MDTAGRTRTALVTLSATALAVALLAGCSSTSDAAPAPVSSSAAPAATTAPVADTDAPDDTSAPAAPVADAYSQVVGGVLYQGTEDAPVKIGTDTPGQAPAYEVEFLAAGREGSTARAEASGKYLVYVFQASGGWAWKIFGMSQHGSYRELADNGYSSGNYLPSRDAAVVGPFQLDGRTLDRSEYLLATD